MQYPQLQTPTTVNPTGGRGSVTMDSLQGQGLDAKAQMLKMLMNQGTQGNGMAKLNSGGGYTGGYGGVPGHSGKGVADLARGFMAQPNAFSGNKKDVITQALAASGITGNGGGGGSSWKGSDTLNPGFLGGYGNKDYGTGTSAAAKTNNGVSSLLGGNKSTGGTNMTDIARAIQTSGALTGKGGGNAYGAINGNNGVGNGFGRIG